MYTIKRYIAPTPNPSLRRGITIKTMNKLKHIVLQCYYVPQNWIDIDGSNYCPIHLCELKDVYFTKIPNAMAPDKDTYKGETRHFSRIYYANDSFAIQMTIPKLLEKFAELSVEKLILGEN